MDSKRSQKKTRTRTKALSSGYCVTSYGACTTTSHVMQVQPRYSLGSFPKTCSINIFKDYAKFLSSLYKIYQMANTKIIQLLNHVLRHLENLITKLDDTGLLSMTRIGRSGGESLEKYRRVYAIQNGQPSSSVARMDVGLSSHGQELLLLLLLLLLFIMKSCTKHTKYCMRYRARIL